MLAAGVPAIAESMIQRRMPFGGALAALTLLLLATPQAGAQTPTPAAGGQGGSVAFEEEFKRADVDKDGRLTEKEAVTAGFFTDGSFKDTDRDLDGQVTLFELGDALQKRMRQWLSDSDSADTDKDGYVSESEASAAGGSILDIFKRADRDGDGRVARDEIDVYTRDTYYSETADRGVVPNIIEKRF